MQNNENVCRFCLKLVLDANVEFINEVTRKMLVLLLIKLDLDVSENPLACKICLGIFNEIYTFKSKCLRSEEIISTHFESNLNVCLRDILIELENDVNIAEDEVVCRLCIKIPHNGSYIALNGIGEEVSRCRDMMEIYLPEININIVEEHIICEGCRVLLKNYVSFATNCMDVEQEIKMYSELQGRDVKEPVNLLCVLQFTESKAMDYKNSFNRDLVLNQEKGPVDVKIEKVEKDNQSEDHFTVGGSAEFYIKEEEVEIKSEDDIRIEIWESDQLDGSDSIGESGSPKKQQRIRKYKPQFCPKCPYVSMCDDLRRHMRSHSHDKLSECCLCPFTADNMFALKTHMASHKGSTNMFYCTECPYESHTSYNLVRHLLKHKDELEVEMHKCPLCPYENRNEASLQKHLKLQHKENIKIYQCKDCSWNTKYGARYVKHQLLHKMVHSNKSEPSLSTFSCDQCDYSTHATQHLVRHKYMYHTSPSGMYQCNQCDYRTENKRSWYVHKNTHGPAEHKFKCEKCEYSTHFRSNLNKHLVTHMEQGEVAVYNCARCDFKSKYKRSLKHHLKRCSQKKDTDARVILQCNQCDFQTKSDGSLRLHMKTHDPTKHKFKCERCKYWSYYPSVLKKHLLTHMELGETVVYYCLTCDFKSKYKNSLRTHKIKCLKKKEKDIMDSMVIL